MVSQLLVFKFSPSIARLYMCRCIIRLDELNRLDEDALNDLVRPDV